MLNKKNKDQTSGKFSQVLEIVNGETLDNVTSFEHHQARLWSNK